MRVLTLVLAVLAIAGMAQADFLLDFGEAVAPAGQIPYGSELPTRSPDPYQGRYWNNVWTGGWASGDPNEVASFSNLVDTTGAATGVSASVRGFTTDGTNGIAAQVLYPQSAQQDGVGCKHGEAPGIVTISGLTEPEYTIRLFSSATTEKYYYNDDNRRTLFTVNGVSKIVHPYGNTDSVESFYNVAPVDGTIAVEVTGATPGGEETYSFGYLNVMELVVPEPATLSLLALCALAVGRKHPRA